MYMTQTKLKASGFISHTDSTYQLKHYFHLEKMLMQHIAAIIPAVPDWQIKQALGLHQWQDSIHANELRIRTKELRDRPDKSIHEALSYIGVYLALSPGVKTILKAIYESLKPRLINLCTEQLKSVFPVHDAPTLLLLKHICDEEQEGIHSMSMLLTNSLEFEPEETGKAYLAIFDQVVQDILYDVFHQSHEWTPQKHQQTIQQLTEHTTDKL